MIRYIYGRDLGTHPRLRDGMFRDRAAQFVRRLGWDLPLTPDGREIDAYDGLDPLYVIWETPGGDHGGSMRLLPTLGPTMVNDYFTHLTDGVRIESPLIWECTRFCLSETADPRVAAALMLAGGEVLEHFGVAHFVGVFDARMVRIYRRIGASPEVLGSAGRGRAAISVGLWSFETEARARVATRAGIAPETSRRWFDAAFGTPPRRTETAHVSRQANRNSQLPREITAAVSVPVA
ncbi:Isovaleryl-homoserine lactone synthase [Roseivivax jejudonensis]|uniref:Acyl-homoserine-lactone synthase n=1 Tax=Roseivivax jejudonensis TaxID=1529041 RepID=A0A1X6ZSU5_9RHOB|nr:acyl-homoserine-lactone synthase [Roseivivax jejudonensis]SLN59779.1 Isovaleryl-homoserine lactone synthase [Roseivivax jejudonensis]